MKAALSSVRDEFKCPICLGTAFEAVMCRKCKNLFCKKCTRESELTRCPMCKTRPFKTDRYGKFDEIVKNLSESCHRCSEVLQVGEFHIHQKCCKSLYMKALDLFRSLPKDYRDLFKSIFLNHDFIVPRDLYETIASSGLELQTEVA